MLKIKLKRELGLGALVLAGVGTIIGAGIYALIGVVAGLAGKGAWLSFLIASVLAACTGLSYAELSSRFPKDAAEAFYTRKAFGKHLGFLVGLFTIMTGIVASAAVALGFGGYLSAVTGITTIEAGFFLLLLLTLIASWGIKQTALIVSVLSLAQICGLFLIAFLGLPRLDFSQFTTIDWANWPGIMTGAALIFFAYLGFEDMVKLSEEAKDPRRNMPKAIILAIIITTILYIMVIISAISILGPEALSQSPAPLATVASKALGDTASLLITVLALAATASTTLLLIVATSRLMYGMSQEQHDLPRFLAWIHPQLSTPLPAILITTILALPLLMLGKIKLVAELTNFTIFIVFILINLAVIFLRYRLPRPPQGQVFLVPLSIGRLPIIPLIGGVFCLLLLFFLEKVVLIAGIFLLFVGMLISYWHYLPRQR